MTTIQSLMHAPPITLSPDTPVAEAARRMRDSSIGVVLVTNGDDIAGVFSERDLLTRVVAENLDPAATSVNQVATQKVISVPADASLRQCAELLREHGVRHLPVVEGSKPVGIVSARDFFEAVSGAFAGIIENARYEEELRDNIDPYDHMGGGYGR
jgi:CBS domain-containing protein